ncbi:HEPN domain-containing protein [Hymenobacter caeli]|nr:HEPN domain-containing protein [Hymenobacter caeli]
MTKADHIAYWKDTAAFDWPAVQRMMAAGDFVHGLFFAHLVIEKLSKAHWVQDNADDIPPRTHNILRLWQATQLAPTPDHVRIATELNDYQLEGRYPDYAQQLYAATTAVLARQLLTDITALRTWLLSSLP